MNLFNRNRTRSARNPRSWRKDRVTLGVEVLESRQLMTVSLSVGANLNTGNLAGDQSETSIAINPTNPLNLYAVSNTSRRVTFNGGTTWANAGALPGGSCCDNMAEFDKFGNLFVTYISASDKLALSTNGGVSFTDILPTGGIGGDYPGVAVGPAGIGSPNSVVWAYGDNGATIAARGALVTGLGAIGAFTASQSATVGQFGDVAVGHDGRVTVTGTHCTGSANGPCPVKVATDLNGIAAGGFGAVVTVVNSNVGTFTSIPAVDTRTIHAHPNLAYNQMSGRLYITYTDRLNTATADTDIYIQSSADGGATWNPRIKINDDGASGKSQFYSDIDHDETTPNHIALAWYDARNSAANNSAQIYGTMTEHRRGGFIPNVMIATGITNANLADPSFEFGDYMMMDFYGGAFYPSWADGASPSTLTPSNTDAPGDLDLATAKVTVIVTPDPIPPGPGRPTSGPIDANGAESAKPIGLTSAKLANRSAAFADELSVERLDTPTTTTRGMPVRPTTSDMLAEALSLGF